MTASAERIPSEYPEDETRVRWAYVRAPHSAARTIEAEIKEAGADNFGWFDSPQILWFPSLSHARAFCRRVNREIPEVEAELLR